MKLKTRKKLFYILFPVLTILMVGVAFYMKDNSQDTRSSASEDSYTSTNFDSYLPDVVSVHPTKVRVGESFDYKLIIIDQDSNPEDISVTILEGPDWMFLREPTRLGGIPKIESGVVEKVILEISDGSNTIEETFYLLIEEGENV